MRLFASNLAPASANQRIARLATLTAVHRAFHWLHLHQPQLRMWQLEMLAIPAPTFDEAARAAWFEERFRALGLGNVHLDGAGNVLGEIAAAETSSGPCVLLSAHLDTVFPAELVGKDYAALLIEDGSRIFCPGVCDNAAGLTGLLAIAAALRYANIAPPVPLIFAANVGEEGEGDLLGMRHIFHQGAYRGRIAAAIALEGAGSNSVVTKALASRRFRVTIHGPGGHSWTDAGRPNPISVMSRALSRIDDLILPATPRTTVNVGHITGGTSVNSIPESATALIDLRSTSAEQLRETEAAIRAAFEETVMENCPKDLRLQIEVIGDRPGGALSDNDPLLGTIRAVDRHLTLRTEQRLGSTDANIPLSMEIPAVAIGAGGKGGGIHTLQEWYDPTGRETALRRVLLTVLDTLDLASTQDASASA
ncbi:acetylornithine deacetylase/succinyl-diaminopimelate desuccinylase-like protein [Granulicella aggregans]|jgi:tripeptide aminopeptidase|uniref:Acetylornithine deacetylase/succinyl-diaminopimelate desuccinylase-like protein n=1 Tax=Granulicella aggregans TaxID=474949 RepID=A0A7W7ZH13_9BACT|nr:M20/M25/M40 family metallo-hydrolase [Granulicella aggregans]MBB5059459.1 acetylornithine deacetylase/succinyl-diaminopimelate desuccinylase-like protein [Granulicella aggregans]